MDIKAVLKVLGGLFIAFSGALILPLGVSLIYGDQSHWAFVQSGVGSIALGAALIFFFRNHHAEMSHREGFGVVSIGWLVLAIAGAVPFYLSGSLPTFADSFFESMSGLTTTGSTNIRDLTLISPSVLFWRSLTQWIGGMGIIVLALAILPWLHVGGMQMFHAEASGPTKDRLRPRVQDTAKLLWGVYIGFTVVAFVTYLILGMNLFDAICHAFTVIATGGFSTRNGSLGEFSPIIQWFTIFFMFISGVNFYLHYKAITGRPSVYALSSEAMVFAGIAIGATALVTYLNKDLYTDFSSDLRDGAFQVVSILTGTGYGTADYETWFPGAQMTLMVLMVIGGCAGSTSGGLKVVRILLMFKYAYHQMFQHIHPKARKAIRLDHETVSREVLGSILGLFILFTLLFLVTAVVMAEVGMDFKSAGAAALTALTNVGPGFGTVGPTKTFADVPQLGKVTLALIMLVGRLEIYTVLVLLVPSFWKK